MFNLRSQFSHIQLWCLPLFQGNKVPVCCGFLHGMLGNCSYLMVIDPNKQIAFTNLRAKAFPQAAAEPGRSQRAGGTVQSTYSPRLGAQTHLDHDAGLRGFLTVPQQCVRTPTREVVIEAIEGLEVVLTPRPARHLSLKAEIRN